MKLIKILKVAVIPVLTVFSFLSTSNTALADYLTSNGAGGEYRYELWSSDNNDYYLKIWSNEASPESGSYSTTPHFPSSREALIYFDCNYGGQNLPECPR
ncbi:hypothetical protein [Nostoc sp. 'Peltigera malacea cyanobiont' DB3992]|uniref:hypothetical protein n=1 Tax=Nostoc sp. 'Peltigera malacea cyanobiont' DB3992 TaxID=1206980 RepID=UPI000C04C926|nr:hypothetical protein [Nostoc sp. 'Peltigera malacea cyanobiont' DB3992]PHM05807.1 hypothetical protein CK516_38220 [Nostoc sp. 'Peltigera malacea cyanobiont' DB3992]